MAGPGASQAGSDVEFLMKGWRPALGESRKILKPPGLAICGARVVQSRRLARAGMAWGLEAARTFFFASRPPAAERQLLRSDAEDEPD